MTAEIIAVGTELLLGDILNTNAQYLSRELADLGITVLHQHVIGDNAGRLSQLVEEARSRSDLLVFSGGLGPTADDLTKETVAACYGDTLRFDAEEMEKIEDFYCRTGRKMPENNRKQAMVPVKGRKIPNHHGTAPGVWFEDEGGRCAVLMPGPPHELKAMWREGVRPLLAERTGGTLHSITLHVIGGESTLEAKGGKLFANENPTAAIYAKTGECHIRITARAKDVETAEVMCHQYAENFYALYGDAVYDEDVPGLEYTVVRLLAQKGWTAATAESCTGGLVAERMTRVPSSSGVFRFGFVTYANEAKEKLLGVSHEVLEAKGAVSPEVAAQMALGALKNGEADVAVALTGIAGPDGGTEEKPVGLVWVGAATKDGVWVKKLTLGSRDRESIRQRASQYALDLVRRLTAGLPLRHARALTAEEALAGDAALWAGPAPEGED